jgi:hypothetical protein
MGIACWICGRLADTREHRIKKSDLVERFGKGPYLGANALAHVKGGRLRYIQGPDSELVRYQKNLCAACNNSLTQPFDKAYEQFVLWVMQNEALVIKRRVIDFEVVFGTDWLVKQRDLFKFFAKCLGCRIAEAGYSVPVDVTNLLGQTSFSTALYVTFQVNEDQLLLKAEDQGIGTQPLLRFEPITPADLPAYQCGNHYRWLTMMYWYNHYSLYPVGAKWIADAKFVYLGWYEPLTVEERADFLSKYNSS